MPTVAGNSESNRVVVSAMVSFSIFQSQTDAAAPDILAGYAKPPPSPGEGPSRLHCTNITQSASPVPADVVIDRTSEWFRHQLQP